MTDPPDLGEFEAITEAEDARAEASRLRERLRKADSRRREDERTIRGLTEDLEQAQAALRMVEATEGAMGKTKFNFGLNTKGDIDRVSVPLQSGVSDIVFTRKPKPAQSVAGSSN